MTGSPPIGFVADDISGATDLASALAGRGLDTRLFFAGAPIRADGADALVLALKIRSVPSAEARQAAADAAEALAAAGAVQLFSKYCSTFDSTVEGNIGPIADALLDRAGGRLVVHCPAYPANGRTVYLGHLFVHGELLGESPMREHPLNPMRDSLLTRVLAAQTSREVSLVPLPAVEAGTAAVAERLDAAAADGARHAIADAVRDSDLETVAAAVAGEAVAAGGAPFGAAFAVAARGSIADRSGAGARAEVPRGPAAILAGSLSPATREQVARFGGPVLELSVAEMVDGQAALERMADFLGDGLGQGPFLITTEHPAGGTPSVEAALSDDAAARRIERTMGRLGAELERLGVRRLIVAGGETSGAVAGALGLGGVRIGPDISVGVPWMVAEDRSLGVAFKSGNFGSPSFFEEALEVAGG